MNPYLFDKDLGTVQGCFGTVLVTGSSAQQRLLRPLVVGITADLRDICFRIAGADTETNVVDRRSTLTILDDMPTLAPDKDLPATLAQSGGQNLLICGIYHDDAQLRAQWGEEGSNMATTFGEQLAFRGIRDTQTLERIVAITGQRFISIRGQTVSRGGSKEGKSWQESLSVTPTLLPELTVAQVNQGHPDDPDIVLSLHPSDWAWAYSTPYYSHPLWMRLMMINVAKLARLPPQRLHLLSPPDILRGGGAAIIDTLGEPLLTWYRERLRGFEQQAEQYRTLLAYWAKHPALKSYDDSIRPEPAVSTHTWVLISGEANPAAVQSALAGFADWETVAPPAPPDRAPARCVYMLEGYNHGVGPITFKVWAPVPTFNDEAYLSAVNQLGQKPTAGLHINTHDRPGHHIANAIAARLTETFSPSVSFTH